MRHVIVECFSINGDIFHNLLEGHMVTKIIKYVTHVTDLCLIFQLHTKWYLTQVVFHEGIIGLATPYHLRLDGHFITVL